VNKRTEKVGTGDAAPVVKRIMPMLAGRPPELQGAVVADLLAMWLAGDLVPSDPEATREIRERILAEHVEAVRELIQVNTKMMGVE
jgi:hypothetical protein